MIKNIGNIDKWARIIVGVIIAILDFNGIITGTLSYILTIFAIVFIITGFLKFCPLYKIFGINTCKINE